MAEWLSPPAIPPRALSPGSDESFQPQEELQPDDPRVNPELYRLVQKALADTFEEHRAAFNPIEHSHLDYKAKRKAVRMKVIDEYQAQTPKEPSNG